MEFTAPEAPDTAKEYLDENTQTFTEGLLQIINNAVEKLSPSITEAVRICLSLIAVVFVGCIAAQFGKKVHWIIDLVTILCSSLLLLRSSETMIAMACNSIIEMSEYGKLLLPVMTAALAAEGGGVTSAALYAGTAFFNSLLSTLISSVLVPLIYVYLCLCIADCATCEYILKQLKNLLKWAMTWLLKIVLYIFTGYLTITGVISGATDAAALKAAKLAISGAVPVVGSIISDASEAVLVSADFMKNAVGISGLLTIFAICIGPFIKIGCQYIFLKLSGGICSFFGESKATALIHDFSSAMGLLLAMSGTVCLLLLISTVCFMRGIT